MSSLVVIDDLLRNVRHERALRDGETLAAELMRIYADGIDGPWRIYRDSIRAENEIAALDLANEITSPVHVYVLVRGPGDPVTVAANIVISLLFSAVARMLVKPPKSKPAEDPEEPSPNNSLSGQTNVLRPGARVPDILGCVRAYPDLITAAVEEWDRRTQRIEQFFVLGVGAYGIEQAKLGETPISAISGATLDAHLPGSLVPAIRAVKAAPEVNGMSLMTEEGVGVGVPGADFTASTMTLPVEIPGAAVGDMLALHNTALNNGFFKITSVSGAGPYVYGLDGAHAIEADANLIYDHWVTPYALTRGISWNGTRVQASDAGAPPPSGGLGAVNGFFVEILTPLGDYRGVLRSHSIINPGSPTVIAFSMEMIDGDLRNFGAAATAGMSTVNLWYPSGALPVGGTLEMIPAATNWYRAPLEDPDAVLIDIGFPNGLVTYAETSRESRTVEVLIEFRRPGGVAAEDFRLEEFTDETTGALHFTKTYVLSELTLGAGVGVEVRVKRTTHILRDNDTHSYIDTTQWDRFQALVLLPAQVYPDVTILQLSLTNTRSAISVGENSLNCVATRWLYRWTPGGWTGPHLTRKWADNLIARMTAPDGAGRLESEIDLAGIYALQSELDAMDGGAQGQISMTLDQLQDIDSELAQIGDVARAQVFRTGRKLFVVRDVYKPIATALFNGRAKSPDAETTATRMSADADNDAVSVQWVDEAHGFKLREHVRTDTPGAPRNALRVGTRFANWPQAWRRAEYEWARLKYRRETMQCNVTEDGRLCRPGDVIMMTDDIANLAIAAGEVLDVAGLTLTLDRDVGFVTGAHSIMLRDVEGRTLDVIPVSAADAPNRVTLARVPFIEIQGRDITLGTLFAFYSDANANVRRWLLTAVELSDAYVKLTGVNDTPLVYAGDSAALPGPPAPVALRGLRRAPR